MLENKSIANGTVACEGSRFFLSYRTQERGIVIFNDTPNKTESKSLSLQALTNIPSSYPI